MGVTNANLQAKVGKIASKIRIIAKNHFLNLFFTVPYLTWFKTSGHTLSPQDQIINGFGRLFFMKNRGVTEPTPL